jgi:hypothetical protein
MSWEPILSAARAAEDERSKSFKGSDTSNLIAITKWSLNPQSNGCHPFGSHFPYRESSGGAGGTGTEGFAAVRGNDFHEKGRHSWCFLE